MVTQDELEARIDVRREKDIFGFEWQEYVPYLERSRLKKYLRPDAKVDDLPEPKPIEREAIIAAMKDYMPFAFEKAHGERGLSASRSIMHFVAWTWLVEDLELSASLDGGDDYAPYGLPMLRRICAHYGFDANELGDEKGQ